MRLTEKTPKFFRKLRNIVISIVAVAGLLRINSENRELNQVLDIIAISGASVGITAQSTKKEEIEN